MTTIDLYGRELLFYSQLSQIVKQMYGAPRKFVLCNVIAYWYVHLNGILLLFLMMGNFHGIGDGWGAPNVAWQLLFCMGQQLLV